MKISFGYRIYIYNDCNIILGILSGIFLLNSLYFLEIQFVIEAVDLWDLHS